MSKQLIPFFFLALILVFTSFQCKKDTLTPPTQSEDSRLLTQIEKDSILNGDTNQIMRILTIFNKKDSLVLRNKCKDVKADINDSTLYRLVRRMYYTVINAQGVGIAAPQVGINRKIIWVKRLDKTGKPFECYLNPVISLYSNKAVTFNGDGCLSIPGQSGNSHRYSAVVVDYDKLDGNHYREIIEGYSVSNFTAIIFQHEIDHLLGILYIDRLGKNGKLSQPAKNNKIIPVLM